MNELLKQIKGLLKGVYICLGFLFVFTIMVFYLNSNPDVFSSDAKQTNTWKPRSLQTDVPEGAEGELVRYGYELILNTSQYIGPLASDESSRYAGNNLSCGNCHLNAGRKIGSGSFIGVANRFPQFRGRENKMGTLEDRIDGCMQRSMNGRVLPRESKEMKAMVRYMEWLSEDVPEDMEKLYQGYTALNLPEERADTLKGRLLYEEKCQLCHMENGVGQKKPGEIFTGYTYPPLGGSDTFNDGAGMNRVITAAEFLKSNMPFGATYDAPQLTDEEAYHLAAYINTFDRPEKANKEQDFPDIKLKPVSTPYGPWADDFSPEQHKFGPFQPLIAFYQQEYGIKKNK
jgi:thiosulfate dehydrogenase